MMKDNWQNQLKKLGNLAQQKKLLELKANKKKKALEEMKIDFTQAIGKVNPIKKSNRYIQNKEKPSPRKFQNQVEEKLENKQYITTIEDDDLNNEPPTQYYRGGQGKNDIKKLLSGQLKIISTLDLHGYTQDEAQEVLNEFIEYIQPRGVCGKIIHGRGLNTRGFISKLKFLVRKWLIEHPEVLAYTEPDNKNDGVVLILLKRKKISTKLRS